jgi:endonuclease/exonuclease/phosphatase family metal-dependent hydrolase
MIKAIKTVIINILTVANLAIVGLLLFTGYSDRINPSDHEILACAGMILPAFIIANLLFVLIWIVVSWKRIWIPLLGFALAYVPIRIYIPLHVTSEPPEGSFKIMTWNVANYAGPDKKGVGIFDSVCNYLQTERPDILCLQEAHEKPPISECYADLFPYNDTSMLTKKGSAPNHMSIHARYPILRKENIYYPSRANGSVAYFLFIEGDTVIVINNHLEITHLSDDDRARYKDMIEGEMESDTAKAQTWHLVKRLGKSMAIRSEQADIIHEYIEQHRNYPIIVCGDFNDTPISYTRHTIAQGLTDCFVESGNGLGVSYNRKGFNFRIDHLMTSEHFVPYRCRIDSKIEYSDHYPLICSLKMLHNP